MGERERKRQRETERDKRSYWKATGFGPNIIMNC